MLGRRKFGKGERRLPQTVETIDALLGRTRLRFGMLSEANVVAGAAPTWTSELLRRLIFWDADKARARPHPNIVHRR